MGWPTTMERGLALLRQDVVDVVARLHHSARSGEGCRVDRVLAALVVEARLQVDPVSSGRSAATETESTDGDADPHGAAQVAGVVPLAHLLAVSSVRFPAESQRGALGGRHGIVVWLLPGRPHIEFDVWVPDVGQAGQAATLCLIEAVGRRRLVIVIGSLFPGAGHHHEGELLLLGADFGDAAGGHSDDQSILRHVTASGQVAASGGAAGGQGEECGGDQGKTVCHGCFCPWFLVYCYTFSRLGLGVSRESANTEDELWSPLLFANSLFLKSF